MSAADNTSASAAPAAPTSEFEAIGSRINRSANPVDGEEVEDKFVQEIESLCMNCHDNGVTRLFLTAIPYFREIILMSFECDKCGFKNNEIQAATSVQPKGTHYELRLTEQEDFSRTVVKSDTATVNFIELDLEVPPGRGQLTNVEGLLSTVIDDLELRQDVRKEHDPEVYEKLQEVIKKGRDMLEGRSFPFRVFVDDPTGNSFIAPNLTDGVGKWSKREYARTPEQNAALGLAATDGTAEEAEPHQPSLDANGDIIPNEVYSFPASCPGCMHSCTTNMKMVDIPRFKQVVLMSTVCDACGYRSNDVKTGGEIPEFGERITLKVTDELDLARDILKSESCALECPELNLSVNPGTLGGRFTTVEGLFTQVRDDLRNQIFQGDAASGAGGDSLTSEEKSTWDAFFENLDSAIRGEREFTVVLSDPLASSYVQSLVDPPAVDEKITRESYKRTEEEEEDLGLKDIKVEGYEEEEKGEDKKEEEKKEEDKA
ncbi:probable zinc finger protein ZPR1 [Cephalotrichum gorgonifer]|uniref:Probable zinc finger protein ZPR1 n=1 Tax=Cephalotrichum gorgonifer TaxID=2041049 RepID=A0AAE8SRT7_9PEZI|nr:probable zinc finger protein ZPR1 [Cephalotrichum gorgonifer]